MGSQYRFELSQSMQSVQVLHNYTIRPQGSLAELAMHLVCMIDVGGSIPALDCSALSSVQASIVRSTLLGFYEEFPQPLSTLGNSRWLCPIVNKLHLHLHLHY